MRKKLEIWAKSNVSPPGTVIRWGGEFKWFKFNG